MENLIFKKIERNFKKSQLLDKNNILWKFINNEWIGKRSVYTKDLRSCWLEDTTEENIRTYWCGGKNANYKETFKLWN